MEYSEKINADLIIIMTHKEKYNFDNYIGAFAHQIINHSKAPVLTITSNAANSETSIINQMVDPLGLLELTKK